MTLFKSGGTVAIFDVDETLIPFKSMFVFLEYAMKSKLGKEQGAQSYRVFRAEIDQYRTTFSREEVNRLFYKVFKGWSFAELEQLALSWWRQIPSEQKWIAESVEALRSHQRQGHPVVLLSGSAEFILRPVSKDLGADIILATTLDVLNDGNCSGEIKGIQTIGDGKRQALAQVECILGADLTLVGYGDHESDLAFLRYCDEGYIVIAGGGAKPKWSSGLGVIASKTSLHSENVKRSVDLVH